MRPARTAESSLLRCQSMPASQTGQRVLYQTVRAGAGMTRRDHHQAWGAQEKPITQASIPLHFELCGDEKPPCVFAAQHRG
jgi:hypothetical protein